MSEGDDGSLKQRPPSPGVWRFANARLDEAALALEVDGQPVKLERKPLELLLHLLRNPERLVRKDELIAAIWPGRILSDSAFTSCVAKLREAFGDQGQTIIRTVHGYGYRLGVPVVRESTPASGVPLHTEPTTVAAPPPLQTHQRSRRLAAIMFTDMVGYTALVQRNEALGLKLLQRQRRIVRACLSGYSGREVEVIGDAFLIEFSSGLRAVECAIALQQQLARSSPGGSPEEQITLRIGIHVGDIVRPGKGLFGDSVNLASRLQAVAPEGGIAMSGMVFDQIYNKLELEIEDRGEMQLKGVERPLRVYCAPAQAVLAATAPAPLPGSWRRPRASLLWGVAAALLAAVATLVLWGERDRTPAPAVAGPTAIAVLPFVDLSPAEHDRYFADGIHDSVLTRLATVDQLKVISRTSVMQYRETDKPINEIAAELRVTHALEGTVQRHAGRVRITAQLVDARDASQIWAETFERDGADIFSIQGDIAQRVAAAVNIALSPRDMAQLAAAPTRNAQAYDLYVQMLALESQYNTADVLEGMETLLTQAIELDPGFALAHAALARTYMSWYRDGVDPSPQRLAQMRRALDAALALQPDLPETHMQLGAYYYEGLRDYASAERALKRTLELMPSAAHAYELFAYMRMDQARWSDAVQLLEKAVEFDPNQRWIRGALANAYMFERRFSDALTQVEILERMLPDDPTVLLLRPFLRQAWTGDIESLRTTLAAVPEGLDSNPVVFDSRLRLAYALGHPAEAQAVIERCDCPWIAQYRASRYPKDLLLGDALAAGRRAAEAQEAYRRALSWMDEEIARVPAHARNYQFRSWALAGLGRSDEALADIDRALELVAREDGWERLQVLIGRARVLAMGGRSQEALELMARLTHPPGPAYLYFWLHEPWTEGLRDHPMIREMIEAHTRTAR